ncbi:cylicin-1-like [Macrosteles quadrilineatus]|uniref:cylicin-1-like n=1 Tax=Macrosteles quadrilineatus TaxID=74068 RepID=UPI0023E16BBC|nr:cylicin-1-like [Macrosteles quadrilineatus]
MSIKSSTKKSGTKSSFGFSTRDFLQMNNSICFGSLNSEHGSKFGRSVQKFAKQNDPGLVQSVSTVNSRVFYTIVNFPLKANSKIPDLTHMEATDCIRELGGCLNIFDYEFNCTSFWLLDILSKLVKYLQLKGFSTQDQNVHLMWFRFVLRCIAINGELREELFFQLQEMFYKAENHIKAGEPMPQPGQMCTLKRKSIIGLSSDNESRVSSESLHSAILRNNQVNLSDQNLELKFKRSNISHHASRTQSSYSLKVEEESGFTEEKIAKNLRILNSVMEMIYDIFADRFTFSLISQTYSSPTIIVPVEIPLVFKEPKLLTSTNDGTLPESPGSKKTLIPKPKKKRKGQVKDNRKGSPYSKDEFDGENVGKIMKKSINRRNKKNESTEQNNGNETYKEKDENKPKLSSNHDGKSESPHKTKGRNKSVGNKSKNRSMNKNRKFGKSITQNNLTANTQKHTQNIEDQQIQDKLENFNNTIASKTKLETKKIEKENQIISILPLSEGVKNGYVEHLINSLHPLETKAKYNEKAVDHSKARSRKSSKSQRKKNKQKISSEKKAKGKKK